MRDVDWSVIESATQGDRGAFEEIYRHYAGMVYGVSLKMLDHVEDAKEVVQDVFVSTYRNLHNFQGQSSLRTWLYRITVNAAITLIRKRKRRQSEVALGVFSDIADTRSDVFQDQEKEEAQQEANRFLSQINPDQRACLILRVQEGLSYEQISQALKININTVRTRLKRARQSMMDLRQKGGSHGLSGK